MTTMHEIAKAAQSIGYAIGVLSSMAQIADLNDRQRDAIDSAVEDLRAIDLLALSNIDGRNAEQNKELSND